MTSLTQINAEYMDTIAQIGQENARLNADLKAEKARSARLLKVAKYAPGYGWNARSFEEREAVRDCEEHGDFGKRRQEP